MSQTTHKGFSLKHAYVAVLLGASSMLAFAQPAAPQGGPGQGMHAGMRHDGQGMGRHDPAKMEAFMAKRHAALKAKLNITAEQEAAWTSYTAAMKPSAGMQMARPDPAEMQKLTAPERMEKMRTLGSERHATMMAAMDKHIEATKTFYAQLNADQKKVFDAESMMGHGKGGHRGQGMGPGMGQKQN